MGSTGLSEFVPLFQTLVWGIVVTIIFMMLRKELREFIQRFSGSDEIEMSLGALSIQAKTMREFQRSLDIGFADGEVMKKELEALIETKIKSIQSAMEFKISQSETRTNPRTELNEQILIKRADGSEIEGTALDISEAGIGFKSSRRLRFNEVVEIKAANPEKPMPIIDLLNMQIVRIQEAKEGYYYGAKMVN